MAWPRQDISLAPTSSLLVSLPSDLLPADWSGKVGGELTAEHGVAGTFWLKRERGHVARGSSHACRVKR